MAKNGGAAEAERWLDLAEKLLSDRDLMGSKTFAIRARECDPRQDRSEMIIAAVDTLMAGVSRINNHHDWYAILQLDRGSQDPQLISSNYARLSSLLSPVAGNTVPFANLALLLVFDAFSVLSNPSKKSLYDQELSLFAESSHEFQPTPCASYSPPQQIPQPLPQPESQSPQPLLASQPPPPARPPPLSLLQHSPGSQPPPLPQQQPPPSPRSQSPPPSRPKSQPRPQQTPPSQQRSPSQPQPRASKNSKKPVDESMSGSAESTKPDGRSFWTACPYCFYLYEYPKHYEDRSLRCQNCRRAFHGAVIPPPPEIGKGEESYFCCWAVFPLGFSEPPPQSAKKTAARRRTPRVYIDDEVDDVPDPSDDSDDDDWGSRNRKKKKGKSAKKRGLSSKNGGTRRGRGRGAAGQVKECADVAKPEIGKNGVIFNSRNLAVVVGKDLGKLDLNVEFSSEVEEPVSSMSAEEAQNGEEEEEEGMEGIAFFEGLDDFFSSLPILTVAGDEMVEVGE